MKILTFFAICSVVFAPATHTCAAEVVYSVNHVVYAHNSYLLLFDGGKCFCAWLDGKSKLSHQRHVIRIVD
jgi:hypothetical protein